MKRIAIAGLWFIAFVITEVVVSGLIVGADARLRDESAEAANRAFAARYWIHMYAVAAVLSAIGTATGFLPGTRRPRSTAA